DASLIRSRRGRLQVVDHDGDNQLGGKDLDRALTRHVAERVREQGLAGEFRRSDPAHAVAYARLAAEAERVRIRLSEEEAEPFVVEGLTRAANGTPVDIRLDVDRDLLARLIGPVLRRTVMICERILGRNRLAPRELNGIVLVGGPTRTPALRAMIRTDLGLEPPEGVDPTTIVAAGAALFAATRRLPPNLGRRWSGRALALHLEYEPMTTNPRPVLAGRVESAAGAGDLILVFRRDDGGYTSPPVRPDARGAFATQLPLLTHRHNVFAVTAEQGGVAVAVEPPAVTILHGLSVSRPPLSQSVGVMRADNSVSWFFRRGTSLPARATLTFATAVSLRPGQPGNAIDVPLVQGENDRADRNHVIGVLKIRSTAIDRDLPVGTEVEVALSVDETSHTDARAYIRALDRWFDEVARLDPQATDAGALAMGLEEARERIGQLEALASQLEAEGAPEDSGLGRHADEIATLIEEGDRDSVELASHRLRELAQELDAAEGAGRISKLTGWFAEIVQSAKGLLDAMHMTREEFLELNELHTEFQSALAANDLAAAEAKFEEAKELYWRAQRRTPAYWGWLFQKLVEHHERAGTRQIASGQIQEGMEAINAGDQPRLVRVCMELYDLLPMAERARMGVSVDRIVSSIL
ncbi:MAG: Hsp70 family protein, partial [Acidimicrobiia bacterium]|nr:Hsp70 family protein [Acidimicrobiia bacterium]